MQKGLLELAIPLRITQVHEILDSNRSVSELVEQTSYEIKGNICI